MATTSSSAARQRRLATLLAAIGLVVLVAPVIATADPAPAGNVLEDPLRWPTDTGVDPRLDDRGFEQVMITLRADPLSAAAAARRLRRELAGRLNDRQIAALRRNPNTGEEIARAEERARERALQRLEPAAREASRQQQHLEAKIRALGGQVLDTQLVGNVLTASAPGRALAELADDPDVAAIAPAPSYKPHGMETTTAAVGAPTFWAAGFEGGEGTNDANPADYAIFSDKLQEDHPVFSAITFQRPPGAGIGTACGGAASLQCDHGTAVGSFAIAGGCGPSQGCAAGDLDEKGVAPKPDSVLDASDEHPVCDGLPGGMDVTLWALGVAHFGTGACAATQLPSAADPAETTSGSFGDFQAGVDDSLELRSVDAYINLGVTWAQSAGNCGPAQCVESPSIAWNTISVGAVDANGTASQVDDTVTSFSARGPTPGGRKKPDLVAVGVHEGYPNRRWFVSGQPMFTSGLGNGTSFSAPQVAGAATLLAGSGVTDPLARKAVLINSARQFPGQTGWQADAGWGELNLTQALAERTNFQAGAAAPGAPRFFRATVQAAADRATLVWNRRTFGCVGSINCTPQGHTLTNLQLEQLTTGGASEASSTSAVDNVEQVRSPGSGSYPRQVIYKVRSQSSVDGLPAEPFAITGTRPLTALATPAPTVDLETAATEVLPGANVTVTASVANPSADLSAEQAEVTLNVPGGVELISGPPTQSLGTLAVSGSAGDEATASWTVRGTADGLKQLAASATAHRYGEQLVGGSDQVEFLVDGTPPQVSLAAPSGTTTSQSTGVSWGATDVGTGVDSFDVERQTDAGPFVTELGGTFQTSAVFATPAGHAYRFRVRARDQLGNTSAFVESAELRVVSSGPPGCPPNCPPPPPQTKRSPKLSITKVGFRRGRLQVYGRLAAGASRKVTVTYRVRAKGRTVKASKQMRPRAGRWKAIVRLRGALANARRGRLIVSYPGDGRYKAGTITRAIRRR